MIQVLDLSLPQNEKSDSADGPTVSHHRCLFPSVLYLSMRVQLSLGVSSPEGLIW